MGWSRNGYDLSSSEAEGAFPIPFGEGRKGGKPFLTVEPVLFVEEGGRFSEEMMAVYGGL